MEGQTITPIELSGDKIEDPTVPFQYWNPISYLRVINEHRDRIALPKPGQFDQLNKEVRSTLLNDHIFDGARADLTKVLSPNFQVMHTFVLGLPGSPSSFNFASVFANERTLLHGTMDTDGNLQSRLHYAINPNLSVKAQAQVMKNDARSMLQTEVEYDGSDYIANAKLINPNPVDMTGIYLFNYLQSVTKKFAVGAEFMVQNPMPGVSESVTSLALRYTPNDSSVWVAQTQGASVLTTSYWRKISPKCDAAAELQLVNLPAQGRRDGVVSVGAKYEFNTATYRAQIDNNFKVSMLLEEKIAPGFSFLLSGEMDHMKGENKIGFGLQLES
ncbi:putative mitochondrial import receptor subunit tom40 [Smittium mucronatum]|uniref:Putative mitochondrial import receptor subunit tom40 n=1 Tax=Smittium mucronatum TaxID=133383 RepID=A0A1R0GYX6_9FUNG|nr:putative mitochondrial import receptor subunit tom40 [Smittium mucronatum]